MKQSNKRVFSASKYPVSQSSSNSPMMESLEDRQLMSVTVNTANVTVVGPHAGARLGISVSQVSGNALVGTYMAKNGTTTNAGKVFMYSAGSATPLTTFTDPTVVANDYFGYSVAGTSDGFVIIGAIGGNANAGRAFLFNASTGAFVCTFNNPTPASGDSFGCSVAQVGTNILIGAKADSNNSLTNNGAAYLFDRTGKLLTTYVSPTKSASAYFGSSVACANGNPVVASFYDNTGAARAGRVYEFDGALRGTVSTAKVTFANPSPVADDHFGTSIAGLGTQLLIGADGKDNGTVLNVGAAYLMDATTGAALKTFMDPENVANDGFGNSVALNSTKSLIGAQGSDHGAANAGAAYLFDNASGTLNDIFYNPTPTSGDNFGSSVSFLGTKVVIGAAAADNTSGTDAGAAYVMTP